MASRPVSVFLDSSVLIAAAISSSGSARDLLNHGFRGEYELIISSDVIAECERNLQAKASAALPLFSAFLTLLPNRSEPGKDQVIEAARFIEAKDAPIVAAAVAAGATYLVSYDRRHMLAQADVIHAQFRIIVTTPDEVLRSDVS